MEIRLNENRSCPEQPQPAPGLSGPSCSRAGARPARLALALLAALGLHLGPPSPAHAGGLFLPAHGVRGLGRGGAFTAGGDDPGGIWYNPANISGLEGWQVLVDGSLILFDLQYQRTDSGGRELDEVSNGGPLLPIPTIAITNDLVAKRITAGISISAPYVPLLGFPKPDYGACDAANPQRCVGTAHNDAPQRYSLITLDGSLLIQLDLAFAVRIIDQLSVGVSVQNLFMSFASLNVISTYAGFAGSPEDPAFDSLGQIVLDDWFTPSAKFGLLAEPLKGVKVGLSVQLPFEVGGDASVNVQLPVSSLYSGSRIEGNRARLSLTLPLMVHVGVELSMFKNLRLEVGFDWEQWSVLDAIRVVPQDIYMYDIPGIDRYKVPEIEVRLNYRDTFTARLGGEYSLADLPLPLPLVLRAGYFFERGAVEDRYASVLAWDCDKHGLTLGASVTVWDFRLDLVYSHIFLADRNVDYRASEARQVNPIDQAAAARVGGGKYSGAADILGMGLSRIF